MKTEKVYFAAIGGRLKVGTTLKDVADRITQISAHLPEPLQIVGSVDGGLPYERAIQAHLSLWHLKGEWFRDCPEVRGIIDDLIARGPDAIGYDGIMFSCERPADGLASLERKADPRAFGKIVQLIWGPKCIGKLSEFAEVDADTALRWIEDSTCAPRLVLQAFTYQVALWLEDDSTPCHAEYFLDQENRAGRGLIYSKLRNSLHCPGMGACS